MEPDTVSCIDGAPPLGHRQARCSLCRNVVPSSRNACAECDFLASPDLETGRIVEILAQRRAIRAFVEVAASQIASPHVATILLTGDALVLDCDARGRQFLKNGQVLTVVDGRLHCSDPDLERRFVAALAQAARPGGTASVLASPAAQPAMRFSVSFVCARPRKPRMLVQHSSKWSMVTCLVSRLDQRRFATGHQLMELFSLTAAEARLARALCQGDSLEEYARHQGLKLPTVRTQLRSVLAKTGTLRQGGLVRLIAGIPAIR